MFNLKSPERANKMEKFCTIIFFIAIFSIAMINISFILYNRRIIEKVETPVTIFLVIAIFMIAIIISCKMVENKSNPFFMGFSILAGVSAGIFLGIIFDLLYKRSYFLGCEEISIVDKIIFSKKYFIYNITVFILLCVLVFGL